MDGWAIGLFIHIAVAPDAALETLPAILSSGKIAIVLEGNRPTGIVTKIDLIDCLAGRIT